MKGCVSLYHDSVSKLTKTDQLGRIINYVFLFVPLTYAQIMEKLVWFGKIGLIFNSNCNNYYSFNPTHCCMAIQKIELFSIKKKSITLPIIINLRVKANVLIFLAFQYLDNEVIIVGRGTFYKLIHLCWYKKAWIDINCLFKSLFTKLKSDPYHH